MIRGGMLLLALLAVILVGRLLLAAQPDLWVLIHAWLQRGR